jgi:small subunit ribosomal protein S9
MALIKLKNLETLVETKPEGNPTQSRDSLGRTYGTGRRKNAVARVWVKAGRGDFTVNNQTISEYFKIPTLCSKILRPLGIINSENKFDIFCTVKGGGHSGQAGAVQLGIARALDKFDSAFHTSLRKNGMLTRDSRVVERKKYGKRKARKSTQFSKR